MPIVYKVLGQSLPAANANTTIYTVPAGNSAVVSTLSICNTSQFTTTIRVAVVPNGETLQQKHYIIFDNWVNYTDSLFLTVGLTMGPQDSIIGIAAGGNVAFTVSGTEIY